MTTNDTICAKEAADILGCDARTVKNIANRGHLPFFMIGNEYRFTTEAVERYKAGYRPPAPVPEPEPPEPDSIDAELIEADKMILLATKQKELATLEGSLVSQTDIDNALAMVEAKDKDVAGREEALRMALASLYKERDTILGELATKKTEAERKWGTVEAADKALKARETKVENKEAEVSKREHALAGKDAELNDLKRIIQLVVLRHCGEGVWYEVATTINKIATDRIKNKAFNQPIGVG